MAAIESSGVPAVGMFGVAFAPLARFMAKDRGLSEDRVAVYDGVIATDDDKRFNAEVIGGVLPQVIRALTTSKAPAVATQSRAVPERGVAFRGSFEDVIEHFHQMGWSDGLPVIPPTRRAVDSFLACTDREPGEVLGAMQPSMRLATVRSVAVNGVIAGCRPEYMPLLVAITEALADPRFRALDAGSTPGWEPLTVVAGPAVEQLDFNSGTGVMRVGRQANASVGRFARLILRNVAGFLIPPGVTDQAGFGSSINMAMAENQAAADEIGWLRHQQQAGYEATDSVVTVRGVMTISAPVYSLGARAKPHLDVLCYYLARTIGPSLASALKRGEGYHLLGISPSVASVLARNGLSKADVREYLFRNSRIPAREVDGPARRRGLADFSLEDLADRGVISGEYVRSSDPRRLIPVLLSPESIDIVVSGNPGRNQSRFYVGNHIQGRPVTRPFNLAGGVR
jgi:hypothetical protein